MKKTALLLVSTAMIIFTGYLDCLSGSELSIYLSYIVPLYIASGQSGLITGIVFSLLISLTWMSVDLQFGMHGTRYGYHAYDFMIRLALFILLSWLFQNNKKLLRLEMELSRTDKKTGAFNERALAEIMENELQRVTRHGRPLSICAIDMDNFKEVNDSFGHQEGDRALTDFADSVRRTKRTTDSFFRTGGDEFLLLLPFTGHDEAGNIIKRIMNDFGDSGHRHGITLSAGITETAVYADRNELIKEADALMYRAKKEGKNRVVSALHAAG